MFGAPFEFKPSDFFDQAFLESKEGDWTNRGFTLPSGTSFPDPMPGMVYRSSEPKAPTSGTPEATCQASDRRERDGR